MDRARRGLSLFGFLDRQAQATGYLRGTCVPDMDDEAELAGEWLLARSKLGPVVDDPGRPRFRQLPKLYQDYVALLASAPWLSGHLNGAWADATFGLVEIDALLTFQCTLDVERANSFLGSPSRPPDLGTLLDIALPRRPKNAEVQLSCGNGSAVIKSTALDLQAFGQGVSDNFAGLRFGFAPPLVHVVRYNGRCYLHNGVHRAYAARVAGASEIPCIFRDVTTEAAVGIAADGSTFGFELMESANPPTMAHFTHGRAHPVSLRSLRKIIHVSWSEYTVADD